MKLTLEQAFEAIKRGETSDQYKKRIRKIRRLSVERDFLEDSLTILTTSEDKEKADKNLKRLNKVKLMIKDLQ